MLTAQRDSSLCVDGNTSHSLNQQISLFKLESRLPLKSLYTQHEENHDPENGHTMYIHKPVEFVMLIGNEIIIYLLT